jgi:glutamate-ammonia-ligase adenylyltransferase
MGETMDETFRLLERSDSDRLTKAKKRVNEMVAARLAEVRLDSFAVLYPMHIEVEQLERSTLLRVVSEDTPFFLYSFSTALSLRNISIERVQIRTKEHRILDEFEFVDAIGKSALEPARLNEVKLSLLVTKQFTYFLSKAADPYAALTRFETLCEDILKLPQQGRWFDLISNPGIMADLAKLLGTSDFIWEDFIRLNYENLLPMLSPHIEGRKFATPPRELDNILESTLQGARNQADQMKRLNAFKDREIFLIDLDHILNPADDFRHLAERLTLLAEKVVGKAVALACQRLENTFGPPKTVAGLKAQWAVFGLGKLGGQALGYASDIEILLVYSDSGSTSGVPSLSNAEFFEKLVKNASGLIQAKREGIFHVDLRLRPYGVQGPLAASLEAFCRYYAKDGPAHSYERLALVRLRAIGGDASFGSMVERLRDQMIYSSRSIRLEDLRKIRAKQMEEKTEPGRLNAKYSSGALVDLEYAAQILQVRHGESHPELRTPILSHALAALGDVGVLEEEEARSLVSAYHFLRKLINGLRMLRGSARDLFLPPKRSVEFTHLARRIGYTRENIEDPETALYLDFETSTATVRAFIERHFGRASLTGSMIGNVADLVLSDFTDHPLSRQILTAAGFHDPQKATVNLRSLAGKGERREFFARLAVLACDHLKQLPDPDRALNSWERFVESVDEPKAHFAALLSQPMRLKILLSIFSLSQFLSNSLIKNPDFWDWVTRPDVVTRLRSTEEMESDLRRLASGNWLNTLRIQRRREFLRIGTRDLCLGNPVETITEELSNLAEAICRVALDRVWSQMDGSDSQHLADRISRFCVVAFGKLGGRELNYSSDIDLMGIYRSDSVGSAPTEGEEQERKLFGRVMERLRSALADHTKEGYVYRVDLRLRPYGRAGLLAHPFDGLVQYYSTHAEIWEVQALLKVRPLAGNLELGEQFLSAIRPVIMRARSAEDIVGSIRQTRSKAAAASGNLNIKEGSGGIRDLEFLTQGLQMIHAPNHPELLTGNTLEALKQLGKLGLLPPETVSSLRRDYLFLRKVEHYLQIWEDQKVHSLPRSREDLDALAGRLLGNDADSAGLLAMLQNCQNRIRKAYSNFLMDGV